MFRVHFLDVGRGDTTVLQFDNGRTYLIDHYEAIGKRRRELQPMNQFRWVEAWVE